MPSSRATYDCNPDEYEVYKAACSRSTTHRDESLFNQTFVVPRTIATKPFAQASCIRTILCRLRTNKQKKCTRVHRLTRTFRRCQRTTDKFSTSLSFFFRSLVFFWFLSPLRPRAYLLLQRRLISHGRRFRAVISMDDDGNISRAEDGADAAFHP